MAIINCPYCSGKISDKADFCVHCSKELDKTEEKSQQLKCEECGANISISDERCLTCGFPISGKSDKSNDEQIQTVEVASVRVSRKAKRASIIAIVSIALVFGAYLIFQQSQKAKAEANYILEFNEYITTLEKLHLISLDGGAEAESISNLTRKVWNNSIYEEEDAETDPYTRPGYYFVSDFNEALQNLYSTPTINARITKIESNQELVKKIVKELQNPPKGLESCFETSEDLYEAYKALTDLAINPKGNLSSYSESVSSAINDYMAALDKLDNQLPSRMK